jgi:hypothetical protein
MRWWLALVLVACNPGKSAKDDLIDHSEHDYQKEADAELARIGKIVTDFRDDLVAGRFDAAHARLAPMTQATLKVDDLGAIAKHPALAAGVTYTISRTSTTNGLSTATGRLDGPAGRARLEVRLTAVDNAWRLSGISVDGAVILPPH